MTEGAPAIHVLCVTDRSGLAAAVKEGLERVGGVTVESIRAVTPADPPDRTSPPPDLAFVSAARLAENATDEVFLAIAPDLAVEVLSPSNSASEIQRKTFEYLDAGARLVWIVDPEAETVTVYRARDDIRVLGVGESLDGTAAVPGLEVGVEELFG